MQSMHIPGLEDRFFFLKAGWVTLGINPHPKAPHASKEVWQHPGLASWRSEMSQGFGDQNLVLLGCCPKTGNSLTHPRSFLGRQAEDQAKTPQQPSSRGCTGGGEGKHTAMRSTGRPTLHLRFCRTHSPTSSHEASNRAHLLDSPQGLLPLHRICCFRQNLSSTSVPKPLS